MESEEKRVLWQINVADNIFNNSLSIVLKLWVPLTFSLLPKVHTAEKSAKGAQWSLDWEKGKERKWKKTIGKKVQVHQKPHKQA